jgi:hypothetical protein
VKSGTSAGRTDFNENDPEIVVPDYRQEVQQPRLDLFDLVAEFGKPICESTETLRFEGRVVGNDVSTVAENSAK